MKKYIVCIICFFMFSSISSANTYLNKNLLIKNDEIEIEVLNKQKIILIKSFKINISLPIGKTEVNLKDLITIPVRDVNLVDKTILIKGSDVNEGTGTEIKIEICTQCKPITATVFIESSYEEYSFIFIPQLVPVIISSRN